MLAYRSVTYSALFAKARSTNSSRTVTIVADAPPASSRANASSKARSDAVRSAAGLRLRLLGVVRMCDRFRFVFRRRVVRVFEALEV
jgi:hypothetical protein